MRHHDRNRKFGRKTDERQALMRSLARSFVLEGKIVTTEARAKSLRPYIERLITKGKENTIASKRLIISRIGDDKAAKKICDDIAPRYQDRDGGYTRVIKMQARGGDASPMAVIEFV
jgi:large subunit ribosomal protein L17